MVCEWHVNGMGSKSVINVSDTYDNISWQWLG